ncbi:sulfur oxidation c-type cytochrome SoxX [Pararhizobium haloflavum]|uniref:sulfur oxidation c-type cytochrome SoxX n=1 Tax=Pararhizobium haloflavum TaxID=2037914 RepID=UPI000C1920DE|nr:sulfur oxidation c-type cytochrome SoxX [Pararhizobium haloflavum]
MIEGLNRPFSVVVAVAAGILWTGAAGAQTAPDELDYSEYAIEASLTGEDGAVASGREIFADRSRGNCVACHVNSEMPEADFQGNVGPSIDGVGDRWQPEQLRAIVSDAKKIFGDQTIMPAFYSLDVGINVREDLKGKTILTAQEVEDVVAYLSTLKEEQ